MNWLTNLFSSGATALVDSIGSAIDKLTTTDGEKLQLKNELTKEMNEFKRIQTMESTIGYLMSSHKDKTDQKSIIFNDQEISDGNRH